MVVLTTLLVVFVGGTYLAANLVTRDIERIPNAFADISEAERPEKPAAGPAAEGMTFLLAGTDRRSDVQTTGEGAEAPTWIRGGQRSDAIMLVHVTGDRKQAYVISIPRDSWVEIPGKGFNKINAAFSLGGPSLYVRTIEQLTGIRIDHLGVVDWAGFTSLIDAVGGVELTFNEDVQARGKTIPAGTHLLSGEEALDYVGERKALERGDFDRIQRQQNVMRAVMSDLLSSDTLGSPTKVAGVASSISDSVSLDDQLSTTSMMSLAVSMRDIRSRDVIFVTAPVKGVGMEGSQSVVYLDQEQLPGFWAAVREDRLPVYLEEHPNSSVDILGDRVN